MNMRKLTFYLIVRPLQFITDLPLRLGYYGDRGLLVDALQAWANYGFFVGENLSQTVRRMSRRRSAF